MGMKMRSTEIGLPADGRWLDGVLSHRPNVPGLILHLDRGGSALQGSRGSFFTDALANAGFATLHVGMLSHDEERRSPEAWRQVAALVPRILAIIEWIEHQPALQDLPLGVLARDAAVAALIRVAARDDVRIDALASRSGRPDLAGLEPLRALKTPIMLVTGELDDEGPGPNQSAYEQLSCPRELVIIPGASRAFEELGTLEQASIHIMAWFQRWMPHSVV